MFVVQPMDLRVGNWTTFFYIGIVCLDLGQAGTQNTENTKRIPSFPIYIQVQVFKRISVSSLSNYGDNRTERQVTTQDKKVVLAKLIWKSYYMNEYSSVQFSSVAQPCLTFCNPMNHVTSRSITNSQNSPKLMCIESVMPSSHLILCCPFPLPLPIPPASGSFPMSQLFS